MNQEYREDPANPPRSSRLKRIALPAITILLVIVLSVVLYVFRGHIAALKEYAYFGVFVVSALSSATIVLPVPGVLIFIPLLTTLNPILVGLIGAGGSIIGECTAWAAGRSGSDLASRGKTYERVERWMKKRGILIIFLFAALPILPMDIAGIVAGALKFPLWKFVVVGLSGKIIKYVSLMLLAAWGVQWLTPWITRLLS